MNGFNYKNDVLYIDDVNINDIANKHQTPFYVYSTAIIKENYNELLRALSDNIEEKRIPLIAYATKANGNLSILKILAELGTGADVVSGGELLRAVKVGIAPEKIVFSGVGKTDEEIGFAIDYKIKHINVESAPELMRIEEIAKQKGIMTNIVFRLNPNVDAGTHEKITTGKEENKFGLDREQVVKLFDKASASEWIKPIGLSIHIGSQIEKIEPFKLAFNIIKDVVNQIKGNGHKISSIDVGGGINIVYEKNSPYLKSYAQAINEIIVPLNTDIVIEPGRMIVANSCALISKITYIKKDKKKQYLILDSGMNDMVRPAMYDAFHPIKAIKNTGEPKEKYDIVGPICESSDIFGKDRLIQPSKQGDLIATMECGAYGISMASNYNTRPIPSEILVDGDNFRIIRKKQKFEDIIRDEVDYL